MSYTSHPKPRINKYIFQQGGTHGAQMSGAFEPFECLWMHIWAWHFCCISKTLPGLHGTIFCRSDLSSSGPPQRQRAAHLDHEQRSRISRKQDIRMCNCASCNGNSNQTQLWGINQPITNSLKSCQWQQKVSEESEQKTLPIWAFDIKILDVNLYYEDNSWK